MPYIKKVKIGSQYFDIYDTYARARLDGQGANYVIGLNPFNDAADNTEIPTGNYRNVITEYLIEGGTPGPVYVNKSFNTSVEPVNININSHDSEGPGDPSIPNILILTSSFTENNITYKNYICLDQLEVGDVILVADNNVPDRWADVDSTQIHFRALESKAIDISGKVDKDIYPTGGPNTNQTGSYDYGTKNTSSTDLGSATGSATVKKQPTVTGSYDYGTKNTSSDGAHTINGSNFTFTGTTATLTPNVSVGDHAEQTLTVTGSQSVGNHSHSIGKSTVSLTYVSDVTVTGSAGAHTHGISAGTISINDVTGATTSSTSDHTHTVNLTKNGYGFSSSTTIYAFNSAKTFYAFSSDNTAVMSSPTVNADGVLSFSTTDMTQYSTTAFTASTQVATGATTSGAGGHTHTVNLTSTAKTVVNSVTVTESAGGHTHSITPTKATQTVVTSVDANTGNGGSHTVQGSNFSVKVPTLTHSVTNGSFNYQPAGTIGGSQNVSSHTHSVTIGSHTHTVTANNTTETVPVSVAIGSHTHSVTIGAHTHTLSNHTHSVDLN